MFLLKITNYFFDILIIFKQSLILAFNLRKTKKKIFFQVEGGFGHTITSPHLLNCLYNNEYLLIFIFNNKRHNKLIIKYFPNLIFINSKYIYSLGIQKILNYLIRFSFLLFSKKITIFNDWIFNLKYNDVNQDNKKYLSILESRYFPVFLNNKINFYDKFKTNNKIILNSIQKPSKKFEGCLTFNLRVKSAVSSLDFSNTVRNTRDIDDYKKTITNIIANNWQVIFAGDEITYPGWIKDMGDSVIFRSKTKLNIDEYHLFSQTISNIFIGTASGSMCYYLFKMKPKILLLECNQVGYGYPYSILSYSRINYNNFPDFKDKILNGIFYDKNIYSIDNKTSLTEDELSEITIEFLNNINNENYGIPAYKLGINQGVLYDTKSRFSEKWLEINNLTKFIK